MRQLLKSLNRKSPFRWICLQHRGPWVYRFFVIRRKKTMFLFPEVSSRDIIKELGLTGYSFGKGSAREFHHKRHSVVWAGAACLTLVLIKKRTWEDYTCGTSMTVDRCMSTVPKTLSKYPSFGRCIALNTRQGEGCSFYLRQTGHHQCTLELIFIFRL